MKPAPFAYVRARSADHVLTLLAEHGDNAKVIAGGQSLGPLLNMRLATPELLIDINDLAELGGVRRTEDGALTIGALTRHRLLESDMGAANGWPLFRQAVPYIGHRAVRNRGTIGGSLAHADPAAELPSVVTALGATIVARSARGIREIAAEDFFESFYTNALDADELLTEVRVPSPAARQGSSWAEFAPRHGDYGYVGVAALVTLGTDGTCAEARLTYSGIDSTPVPAAFADTLVGLQLNTDAGADAIEGAAVDAALTLEVADDATAPAGYRRRLIYQLTRQTLAEATQRAAERTAS